MTAYRTVDVDGVEVFYREAGDPGAPTLLLLHGFPTSSTQYQELIDRLSDRFHLVAPDYPGFGYTEPLEGTTTFDRLADVVDGFVHALDLDHYGLYVFDFGAPVGFRLATRHPERVDALIVQNGNAYEAGIGPNLAGLAPYWEDRVAAEPAARTFLQLDATRAQYVEGVADPESLDPDLWTLDQHFLDLPRRDQVMLDLFYDYTSNVALYPTWQTYLREQQPATLVTWGANDRYFVADGARAYLTDLPNAELHLLDTGHFALATHAQEIADLIAAFHAKHTAGDPTTARREQLSPRGGGHGCAGGCRSRSCSDGVQSGCKVSAAGGNCDQLGAPLRCEIPPEATGSFRLGAGRSQVQILSPRSSESPGNPRLSSFS